MNLEPRKMIYLLRRELYEFRSSRLLAAFGIFGLLQGVIMFSARAHGRTEDTILVFLIGGLSTVITAFDLVAREREQHTIDLLLTQGVSRTSLFLAKGLTAFLFSVIGALVFCVATVSGTAIAGYPVLWGDLLPEFGMITWMMGAYAAIALACSVIFRRPKTALIGAMMTWEIGRAHV